MARSSPRRTRAAPRRSKPRRAATQTRYWSSAVTQRSNALDLESSVFAQSSPRKVALSLKRSAERSRRRKGTPYQSAMSMLNFYINRAGSHLSPQRKGILEKAKGELRREFGRNEA